MLSHSSHFQINGGHFHNVVGDVHLHLGDGMGVDGMGVDGDDAGEAQGRNSSGTTMVAEGIRISTPNVNRICSSLDTGIHILHQHVALEASCDSTESFDQPKCHHQTRIEMLDDLFRWAEDVADDCTSVLWLHGPAGAGKSAIMQAIALRLQEAGLLGGSFFFQRGHPTRGNARVLFATLAYQLALQVQDLKPLIAGAVEKDPSLVGSSLAAQLKGLIVSPCLSAAKSAPGRVLLIDGLDECDGTPVQREVLRLVKVEQAFADVEVYLSQEFSRIHEEHRETMVDIPAPWPSFSALNELVTKSSGYFIYAATVIKFIDDRDFRPTDQLDIVLDTSLDCDPSPFEPLDKLYLCILSQVPARSRPGLLSILSVMLKTRWRLPIRHVEQLLELGPGDVRLALRRLGSLLHLGDTRSADWIVTPIHASFGDFLSSRERSGAFYVGGEDCRVDLARSVGKVLQGVPVPEDDYSAWGFTPFWVQYNQLYCPSQL
ncbi:hypothetical protein FB45DRAFT_1064193 [Roridomyces roridus]|uniref:Nephrocystin 3-like N-terminal domain-containing protein n=1 Tax=Roridomyces roridus TaxID=1738132 RepID=A0AAD7BB68_9AGAR|nr:hypothetical protein FB45DRAFT_1064193 [Roridomyces roridus]